MEHKPTLGCVLMAAGNARRFGQNKLSAALDGRSLILRALEAVPSVLGVFWVLPARADCSTLGRLPVCGWAPPLSR